MIVGELLAEMGVTVNQNSFNQAEAAVSKLKGTALKLLGAIGIGLSVKGLVDTADTYQTINDKIIGITKSQEQYKEAQQEILAASKDLRTSYSSLTSQVESLMKSGKASTVADAIEQIRKQTGVTHASIGSAIQSVKDQFGIFVADLFESMEVAQKVGDRIEYIGKRVIGVLNRLKPYIERVFNFALKGVDKIGSWVERFLSFAGKVVDTLGGTENVLRLIGLAIGVIVGYKILTSLQKILALFNPIYLGILLILLIAEDFIAFMEGKDSMIGDIFEAFGISADEARENINNALDDIRTVFGDVMTFCTEHSDLVKAALLGIVIVLGIMAIAANPFLSVIMIISAVVVALAANWDKVKAKVDEFKQSLEEAGQWLDEKIIQPFKQFVDWAKNTRFGKLITQAKEEAGDTSDLVMTEPMDVESMMGSVQKTKAELKPEVQAMMDELMGTVADSKDEMASSAETSMSGAVEYYEQLATDSETYGKDMMQNYADGILNNMELPLGAARQFATEMDAILGFSLPEKGPLAEADKWMPDMMQLLANGIAASKDLVLGNLSSMVADMSGLVSGGIADIASLNAAVSSTNNNVNQRVSITNNFAGDRAAQLQGAKAMNKSAKDASAYMADALRFGR